MAAYGSDQDFLLFLAGQGLSLPPGAPAPLVLRTIGSAYVDAAYEHALACSERADPFNQDLAWPRRGAKLKDRPVPDNLVPRPWVLASYRAAWLQASSPGWAMGGRDPSRITRREKVGAIEREFFEAGKAGPVGRVAPGFNVDGLIDGQVAPWLCAEEEAASGFFLFSVGGCPPGIGHNSPPPDPVPPPTDPETPGGVAVFGEGQITITQHVPVSSPSVEFGEGQIIIPSN